VSRSTNSPLLLKVICVCLVMSLVFLGPIEHVLASTAEQDDYTILVYMNGSDLESGEFAGELLGAATEDLNEMMKADSTGAVNIIVETGGTLAWANDIVDPEKNQRWLVEQEGLVEIGGELGKRNMGESKTLSDFLTWGIEHYPAKQYALIFWDHGAGSVYGFGADEHFLWDSLTLDEIQVAMETTKQAANVPFELIGFDACLMAGLEVAAMLDPYANYLVASEELVPGHGWDYTAILNAVAGNPSITGDQLGKAVIDGFEAQAAKLGTSSQITLSVIDLSQVEAVEHALNLLVVRMIIDVEKNGQFNAISKARGRTEEYGSIGWYADYTDMIDLGHFAMQVSSMYPSETRRLIRTIDTAVVHNTNSIIAPNARGLSIYFPYRDKDSFHSKQSYYEQIDFSKEYRVFTERYTNLLIADDDTIQMENNIPLMLNEDTGSPSSEHPITYQVTIHPADLDSIAEMYGVLAIYGEDYDELYYYGTDPDVQMDWESGELNYDFTGEWFAINGHLVSVYVSAQGPDYTEYAVPALLNGEEVDILVVVDEATGEAEILGAWRGLSEETQMADKNIINIKNGDEITPQLYYHNEWTDEEGYGEQKAFIVDEELIFEKRMLPSGMYLFAFQINDVIQNETYSDFAYVKMGEVEEQELMDHSSGGASLVTELNSEISIYLNGEEQHFAQPPLMVAGTTLVPLRDVFEALDAEIEWESSTKTVYATKGEQYIELQINTHIAYVNGKPVQLAQPGQILDGKTMVPLRFVSEALGAEVDWDGLNQTITIEER
jgi:hypothetical protein